MFCYIDAACFKFKKYYPRDVQWLSVIQYIYKLEDKGLVLQIKTGEGKTLIIALLAAFFAIRGRKVDIVTSNVLLARRDCDDL